MASWQPCMSWWRLSRAKSTPVFIRKTTTNEPVFSPPQSLCDQNGNLNPRSLKLTNQSACYPGPQLRKIRVELWRSQPCPAVTETIMTQSCATSHQTGISIPLENLKSFSQPNSMQGPPASCGLRKCSSN
jgi:hypothetical protein